MTGSKLKRDIKENIRLSKLAWYFTELKRLRGLMAENKDNEQVLDILYGAHEIPVSLLEDYGVTRTVGESVFIFDGILTPAFIESFRKTESRKFWE